MLKLIGGLLILVSCASAGLSVSAIYRLRVGQLEGFRLLIAHISAEIGAFLAPLDTIYADFKNTHLEACGFLLLLRQSGFETAFSECRSRLFLTETELSEVEKFFRGLGRHDAREEENHCAYYEKRISELHEAARAEAASKARLCRAFGFLGGLMLAVILL